MKHVVGANGRAALVALSAEDVAQQQVDEAWHAAQAQEEIAKRARLAAVKGDTDRKSLLSRLQTSTPAEIANWVDSRINGTTVEELRAETRAMFKRVLMAIMLDHRA